VLPPKDYQKIFQVSRNYGYSCDEFEISNTFYIRRDECACQFLSTVKIRYIPQNTFKTYIAGCDSYWLISFENDLKDGYFNKEID